MVKNGMSALGVPKIILRDSCRCQYGSLERVIETLRKSSDSHWHDCRLILKMDATIKLISNAVNVNKTKTVSRQPTAKVNQHPVWVRSVEDQAHFMLLLLITGALRGYNTQLGGSQYEPVQHPAPLRCGVKNKKIKSPSERKHGSFISIHQPEGGLAQTRKMPILNEILLSGSSHSTWRGRSHEGLNGNLFSGLKIKLAIILSCFTPLLGTCHIYNM